MSMRSEVRSWVARLAALAAMALLAAPAVAQANGPCGQDANGNSACPLAFPSTSSGSLVTSNESDYYVFSAQAGQEISVTITDTESPSCNNCGDAEANLYDASGNPIYAAQTGSSQPNNGLTVPRSLSWTVQNAGTYYLVVDGYLGRDSHGNPTSVPYTLQVSEQPSPCGYSLHTTGCAINSPQTLSGSLQTDNQTDYYALYARPNTELSATITDTESPSCTNCGDVEANLYDANGNPIYAAETGSSQPNNGITVPKTFSYTVPNGGVYYIEVDGNLGRSGSSNPTAVPYTLQVSASPNVTWPPPAPPTKSTTPPKSAPRAPTLQLGAVHHSGHTVRLTVKLAKGAGKMSATATSGKRRHKMTLSRRGNSYTLTARLPRGSWTIHVRLAGASGWLSGTLSVRVRVR